LIEEAMIGTSIFHMFYLLIVPSTHESPFFLLHGHDPRLPTEVVLSPDYKQIYIADKFAQECNLACTNIKKAQKHKKSYDQHAGTPNFSVGERVFFYLSQLLKWRKV